MKKNFNLVATSAAGLEAIVGREIRDLGIECQVENGKVHFQGDVRTIITTNLWLRAADRIKIVVGNFQHVPLKNCSKAFMRLIGKITCLWGLNFPLPRPNV